MTRDEFLNRLGELLACLPADQVKETQEFYAEAIADRMEDGMTEAEAVAAMGTPGEVAEATLDELPAVPRAIARTKRKSAGTKAGNKGYDCALSAIEMVQLIKEVEA